MTKSVKNCIGYIGQIPKNHDFRKIEKSAPSKIEILVEISMFFMTWSTVQHPETLTPSSILIFQGASVGTLRLFKVVPEWLFQKSAETLVVVSSFATSLRNHILYRTEGILLLLQGSLGDTGSQGRPYGVPGYGSLWGSWVPMGSQGMDPWVSWVPMRCVCVSAFARRSQPEGRGQRCPSG